MDTYDLSRLAASFVLPLAEALEDPDMEQALLGDLGFVLPDEVSVIGGARRAVETLAGLVIELEDQQQQQQQQGSSASGLLERAGPAFRDVVTTVLDLADGLDTRALESALIRETDLLDVLPRRLVDYLCVNFLQTNVPVVHELLQTCGVVELKEVVREDDPHRTTFIERTIHWDRLPDLIADPSARIKAQYAWGSAAGLDADRLFLRLRALATSLGLHSDLRAVDQRARVAFDGALAGAGAIPAAEDTVVLRVPFVPSLDVGVGAELYPIDVGGRIDGVGIGVYADGQLVTELTFSDWLSAQISLSALATGFGALIRPGHEPQLLSAIFVDDPAHALDNVAVDARVSFSIQSPDGNPIMLLGREGASRFQVGAVKVSATLSNVATGGLDAGCEVALSGGVLALQTGDSDGFLKEILGDGFSLSFDLLAGVSVRRGFYVGGGATLEHSIPLSVKAGPLSLDRVTIAVRTEPPLSSLVLSATGAFTLGPVTAVIEDIGLRALVDSSRPGLLGNADLALGFKPPRGVGLTIATQMVAGGGFLFFDPQKEEYGGILQLEIADTVAVKAIGLITTRLPDGSKGFSLLILISAEGFAPIQLGLGFTLSGIGGLFGVNRTVRIDVLRSGIKAGTMGSILFPPDPIRNAAQIVSDLRNVFPPARNRYLFGPMAVIGWGTPTILTLEIALILEIPEPVRLIILGRLTAILPEERAALVRVRMDALGVIDFNQGSVALDATLYDSRILAFALTGDMALRAAWKGQPAFVLAIGGFNPRFAPPAGFPRLKRLELSLSSGDTLRLRCQAYLALTSNTVQFGARIDLHAAGGGFTVDGYLAVDALFHFAPFAFVVDVGAGVALRYHGHLLMGIQLEGTLSGPSPWRVRGKATFKVLFFKVSVSVDHRIGDDAPAALPEPVNVLGLLIAAVSDARNWSSELPQGDHALVTLRESAGGTRRRAHPRAVLAVRQRVVPLNVPIERYGNAPVSGPDRFTLQAVRAGGGGETTMAATPLRDMFALGQFQPMSDDQKLSRPSFETADAGLQLGADAVAYEYDPLVDGEIRYETLLMVPGQPPIGEAPSAVRYVMNAAVLDAVAVTGAAGQAAIRRSGADRYRSIPRVA